MYANDLTSKLIQEKLRKQNRIDESCKPQEKFIDFDTLQIHVDEYLPIKYESRTTVVIFHGVGGNGRLLSFIAIPIVKAGYKVICPDLPGYGFTKYSVPPTYQTWIDIGCHIVNKEIEDGNKVIAFGLSAGGMLAYNIACKSPQMSGLIVTNILDNRLSVVKEYSAKNKIQAKYGIALLNKMPKVIKKIKVPIKMVTNMKGLVNDKEILKLLVRDKHGAGSKVEINFLLTMMNNAPLIEPEQFSSIPALLCHPGDDKWTPMPISELFFDRIKSRKTKICLKNAGHFPIEEPGIDQLEKATLDFIRLTSA
jgi:alpha-beta hydrolase superfamily lysophospholipase